MSNVDGQSSTSIVSIWADVASIVLTVVVSNAQVKQKISEEQLTDLVRVDCLCLS